MLQAFRLIEQTDGAADDIDGAREVAEARCGGAHIFGEGGISERGDAPVGAKDETQAVAATVGGRGAARGGGAERVGAVGEAVAIVVDAVVAVLARGGGLRGSGFTLPSDGSGPLSLLPRCARLRVVALEAEVEPQAPAGREFDGAGDGEVVFGGDRDRARAWGDREPLQQPLAEGLGNDPTVDGNLGAHHRGGEFERCRQRRHGDIEPLGLLACLERELPRVILVSLCAEEHGAEARLNACDGLARGANLAAIDAERCALRLGQGDEQRAGGGDELDVAEFGRFARLKDDGLEVGGVARCLEGNLVGTGRDAGDLVRGGAGLTPINPDGDHRGGGSDDVEGADGHRRLGGRRCGGGEVAIDEEGAGAESGSAACSGNALGTGEGAAELVAGEIGGLSGVGEAGGPIVASPDLGGAGGGFEGLERPAPVCADAAGHHADEVVDLDVGHGDLAGPLGGGAGGAAKAVGDGALGLGVLVGAEGAGSDERGGEAVTAGLERLAGDLGGSLGQDNEEGLDGACGRGVERMQQREGGEQQRAC